jgi:hypothetical protein
MCRRCCGWGQSWGCPSLYRLCCLFWRGRRGDDSLCCLFLRGGWHRHCLFLRGRWSRCRYRYGWGYSWSRSWICCGSMCERVVQLIYAGAVYVWQCVGLSQAARWGTGQCGPSIVKHLLLCCWSSLSFVHCHLCACENPVNSSFDVVITQNFLHGVYLVFLFLRKLRFEHRDLGHNVIGKNIYFLCHESRALG